MNKVAHYLQEHLSGEVVTSVDALRYFSTDCSIFSISPSIITYPHNENDVRKTARFTWQLAERNRIIPITPRGLGSNVTGAAIGEGIITVFPAHMNRILELDSRSGEVTVEPGLNFGKLQEALYTHGRFLPAYPSSMNYSTVGGSAANNSGGMTSVKYGSLENFVKGLRVVLANGEVIETRRLSKRELSKKLGLATYEGEIYRAIDTLIEDNHDTIEKLKTFPVRTSAGYNLADVKRKDKSFDLTPLFIGSQGTLGIITQLTLETEPYTPETSLIIGYCDDVMQANTAISKLHDLKNVPSTIEMIDAGLLDFVDKTNPNQLKGLMKKPFPKIILLIEFNNPADRARSKFTKKAKNILEDSGIDYKIETDYTQRKEIWKLRDLASAVVNHGEGTKRALPIIEDGIVPFEQFPVFLKGLYDIFKRNNLPPAVWGHAGEANLHAYPLLDIGQLGDRQKIFRIIDEYYNLVIALGGSTSAQDNDGRLRGPYVEKLFGPDAYSLFEKVKQILDPYNILNPGVKMGVNVEENKSKLRTSYTLDKLHDHLPRA
jgi:FAD/FMN-containing dehydrogenase